MAICQTTTELDTPVEVSLPRITASSQIEAHKMDPSKYKQIIL